MKNIFSTILLGGLMAGSAFAGPLNLAQVPAQPNWVLHFDCDALRPTQIGQYLMGELQKPEAQDKFAAFQVMFNFDPRHHLHGVTLFSTTANPQDGVLMLHADFQPERLVTLAKAAKEYQAITHGRHTIHSWLDTKKRKGERVYAAIHGSSVMFGQRSETIGASLDVLDGAASNLKQSNVFPQLASPLGFIQGAARKMEVSEGDANAAVLKLARSMRFHLGESQQTVTAALTVETGSDEVAGHVASIAKGLLALAKLQNEKPENKKLAEAASLEQTGANVVCSWAVPAADVVSMLKAAAARKAETP